LQSLLSWCAERFGHENRQRIEAGFLLIPISDYPILGYYSAVAAPFSHGEDRQLQEGRIMTELDPDVADDVPWSDSITPYDEQHFITYLRLLDANDECADWQEVARIVLHRNPAAEPDRTRRCWEAHLRRAKWMTKSGYRKLLMDARDALNPKCSRPH